MNRHAVAAAIGVTTLGLTAADGIAQEWPTYTDETAARMPTGAGLNDPAFTTADLADKNYAWGDVDQDGDVDLVCVRKQPYVAGRRRNVLFMNEGLAEGHALNGVLVDRTDQYAKEATDGGQGFLDLTDDRDVVLLDLDGDGWLDIVTTTTYGQGLPKTLSHPRIYMNKRAVDGVWQGFRYEEARTPTLPMAPNFCGIGFGDVTGNGRPDLYHTDYNNPLEDRLWINDGTGCFTDQSELRMTFEMRESEFGVHAEIADMNGDGVADIVKNRANGAPYRISISYNNPLNEGFFTDFETVYSGSPYYVEVADLNNDGKLDLVLQDDGIDRWYLNQGNGPDGLADFVGYQFPPQTNGFEGTIEVADLNNDGFIDVLITDETVNAVGVPCVRRMRIWRNLGNVPNVTFQEETGGIPISALTGTSDVAPIDLDGDGWRDLVIGTCSGTAVWMSQPPLSIAFGYPQGVPSEVALDGGTEVQVQLAATGDTLDPDSPTLHVSINGGGFSPIAMTDAGGNVFGADLPGGACLDRLAFYLSAELASGAAFTDPPDAPASTFEAVVADGVQVALLDQIEGDVSGWTVVNDPSLTAGAWEQADPNGTISGGNAAAPEDDATPGPGNVQAFVTDNGPPGGAVGANDVDGGPTRLISPPIDLDGSDAVISYARWFFSDSLPDDTLTIEVSNNGTTWVLVETVTTTNSAWETASFTVSDYVVPSATVQVRFSTADQGSASFTEAGIDDFQVDEFVCPSICPTDVNGDGVTNVLDLIDVLLCFGLPDDPPCDTGQDVNGDGTINVLDLIDLLLLFGTSCP